MAVHVFQRLFCAAIILVPLTLVCADDWPEWRGPHGDGTCNEKGLPTKWSPTENVAWKFALPEPGNSTPVVWKDRVFVSQPVANNRRTLICLDRTDGRLLWQTGTEWTEADPTHSTNPICSSSPVTDGERVIVWFGSAGLFCYDNESGPARFTMGLSTSTMIPALASVLN